jgi:hypothetical protein
MSVALGKESVSSSVWEFYSSVTNQLIEYHVSISDDTATFLKRMKNWDLYVDATLYLLSFNSKWGKELNIYETIEWNHVLSYVSYSILHSILRNNAMKLFIKNGLRA